MSSRHYRQLLGLVVAGCFLGGCISTNGAFQPNTQFVYPNSNVTILGPVSASKTKSGPLMFVPVFSAEEVRQTYDEALQGRSGANVIVNFDEDTIVSNYVFFNTITYSVSGQGAMMEVGQQDLY